jgi:glycine cleavage system H protein
MTTSPEPSPEEYAVSPAFGPVPAIYVHLPTRHRRTKCQHVPIGGIMTDVPAGLRYSTDHLWVRPGPDGLVRVGVTDFAQQSLGDVVDVSPPKPGDRVAAGRACGDIESVKSVSDLIAPVTGTARARNENLAEAPDLVNTDPYGQGWLFEVQADPATLDQQLAGLMDPGAYRNLTGA